MQGQISKSWEVGDILLDLYQILETLGESNGMVFYRVLHLGWNVDLMVKVPQPEILQTIAHSEDFVTQTKVWVNLGVHPHWVTCYYVRFVGDVPLVFTELVDGESLADRIRGGSLYEGGAQQSLQRILDVAIQLAWGLDYLHKQGAVYGSIRPSSVLLSGQGVAKLTDLGMSQGESIAANLGSIRADRSSPPGNVGAAYCSPEQAKHERLTPGCDSWSWGLVVLEMFQGERTWSVGTSAARSLRHYRESQPGPIASMEVPPMPEELGWLLRRCFRKNPPDRPSSLDLAAELAKIYQSIFGANYPRQKPHSGKETPESLNNKALSCIDLGKQSLALQLWEQALEIQPYHADSIYNRGLILWRGGRIHDRALIDELKKLRRSAIDQDFVDYLLSLVYLERDDCDRALKLLDSISMAFSRGARGNPIPSLFKGARGDRVREIAQARSPHSMRLVRTFEDHTNLIKSVCFSADGRYVLSGCDRSNLKLWDAQTGECVRTFSGHTQEVKCVCISGDGQYAISASWDKTLKLWDVSQGVCLRSFQPHEHEIFTICLSVDGLYALSGSDDRFKLWQVQTGECLRSFAGHKGDIFSLALSRDSQYALSGSLDKTVKLWDANTGACVQTLHGHDREVTSVCLSLDGQFALSGSSDQTLKLWQLSTGQCVRTLSGHTSEVTSVCLSLDGQFALSGSSDHTLKLWQLSTGRCLRTFEGHTSAVTSVCLSPDDAYVLSGSMDDTLKLWSVKQPASGYKAPMCVSPGRSLPGPGDQGGIESSEGILDLLESQATGVAGAKGAAGVAGATGATGATGVMGAKGAKGARYTGAIPPVNALINQRNYVAAAQQLRKLRELAGRSSEKDWRCEDETYFSAWRQLYLCLPRQGFVAAYPGVDLTAETPLTAVSAVSLSQDGRYAVSAEGGDSGVAPTVRLWALGSGRSLRAFEGHTDVVRSVGLNAISTQVLSGSADRTVRLWSVATGLCVLTLTGHSRGVTSVCFSADGDYVLSGSSDRTIKFWEVATGQCLCTLKGHYAPVTSVCLSPDGRYALSGSADTTLKIWDLTGQRCLQTFKGHQDSVTAVSMSADGYYALSGSADKTLKLWQVTEPRCLQTLVGHTDGVSSACLTLDGRYALSGSADQTVKVWDVSRKQCLHTLTGFSGAVNSVAMSADGSYALCGSDSVEGCSRPGDLASRPLRLWQLDWELTDRETVPWDEGARSYLEAFLMRHSQAAVSSQGFSLSSDSEADESGGKFPTWTEQDFSQLLYTLGCAGYGWLEPAGVRTQLETIAANWQWLSPFISEVPEDSGEEGTELGSFFEPNNLAGEEEGEGEAEEEEEEEEGTQLLSFSGSDRAAQLATESPLIPGDLAEPSGVSRGGKQGSERSRLALIVESGSLKGQRFAFDSRTCCVMGRGKDCEPQLPHDPSYQTISRYHCLLDINPPAMRIRDLDSKNGTFVNGKKIGKGSVANPQVEGDIRDGDRLKLGYNSFRVEINHPVIQKAVGFSSSSGGSLAPGKLKELSKFPSIKGYTSLKFLGQGRVSEVYSVRDNETGQVFALKVMQPQVPFGQEAIEIFQRVLENFQALNHRNIARLYDYGYWGDRFFLLFEYCQGGSVAKAIQYQGKPLAVDESLAIILEVLEGFDYAHNLEVPYGNQPVTIHRSKGLLHGALKPTNIFLVEPNLASSLPVKLGDYGLDRAFDLLGFSGQTMTGAKACRPVFMPRQQAMNLQYIQTDLDIWAAAASLYFMLTGRFAREFTGIDPMLAVLQTQPIPIRDRNPSIPKALAELIDLALVDKPHIHFKKAAAFKRALETVK